MQIFYFYVFSREIDRKTEIGRCRISLFNLRDQHANACGKNLFRSASSMFLMS